MDHAARRTRPFADCRNDGIRVERGRHSCNSRGVSINSLTLCAAITASPLQPQSITLSCVSLWHVPSEREVVPVPIRAFLNDQLKDERVQAVFGHDEITAMSMALEDICKVLKLDGKAKAKEVVAMRIIELARRGERSPTRLRDMVLKDATGGTETVDAL